ncbi:hypothetical protein [Klebsiella phage vB_KpnP_IME205]|uniref:Uncharacterized protein n=1 Tax=Klebsiella phage vB_KpnP_IME205 TaxID=1770232 RepID=A0A0U2KZX7_BPKIM|nr:hypothetical protein HOR12_gp46 [Klebsiella phage vB_KpnP_IME205]ALT58501.1 hypothetical protein [Klebsiella phage vB_KpnP_IME205]
MNWMLFWIIVDVVFAVGLLITMTTSSSPRANHYEDGAG